MASRASPQPAPQDADGLFVTTHLLAPAASTISHAVQALPTLLPPMSPMSAFPALTPPEQHDLLSASGSDSPPLSQVWPSVSDSDEDATQDVTVANRIKYPKVFDDSAADLDSASSKSFQVVEAGDDGGEIIESMDVTPASRPGSAHLGIYNGAEDVQDVELLKDLKAGSFDEDHLLTEAGLMLIPEEAKMRGSGESTLGSTSYINDRDPDGQYTTQELQDDWVGVEDATSSSNYLVQVTHDSEYSSVGTSNILENGSKRVYTFPKREDEVLAAAEKGVSQFLTWPVGLAIDIIGFQAKILLNTFYFAFWLCSFSFSVITFPFSATLKATNIVSMTVVAGYSLATQMKPMIKDGLAQAGPVLKQTTKKCGFGCFAAAYVMFMLGSLLVPALFLDLFLVRGFIDEPVEFRETLHFDYRQEHPSAVVSLLPPKVLAKVQGNVYPDKVLRAHAIPSSHKLQVTIFLTLPESHYNRRLGMFQVSADLLSVRGEVLKRASWPCMLPFQSSPIRYAKQIILGVPLLMGLSRESHMVGLRLFENEYEKATPTAMVRFILEPKAGFPSGQGLPEVYSAEAQVQSVLPWPKELLRRWKWTFYVWSGLSLFMLEVMIVICCCHQVLLPSRLLQGITEGFGESDIVVKETPVKRVGKHGRRVNFSDELPTAHAIREPSKAIDIVRERELLLSNAESTSTLSGPRLRRLSGSSAGNDDASSEASSSWSAPPLKTLDYVGGTVEAVEGSVRSLGETVVEGATEGVAHALHKFGVLNSKNFKSD